MFLEAAQLFKQNLHVLLPCSSCYMVPITCLTLSYWQLPSSSMCKFLSRRNSIYFPRFTGKTNVITHKTHKAKLRPNKDVFLAVQIMKSFVGVEVHPLTFWASALDRGEWLFAYRRSRITVKYLWWSSNARALKAPQFIWTLRRK
jgi:hypothetical protein